MSQLSISGSVRLATKLAARSLIRDRRRTLITTCMISLGLALFIFSDQLQQGTYQTLIQVGVSTQAGHLVVQSEGASTQPKSRKLIKEVSRLTQKINQRLIQEALPALIIPRTQINGMLQSAASAARASLQAIDPEGEPKVSDWKKRLVSAPLPSGEEGEALQSHWLTTGDTQGILLGYSLAQRLDLTVGDKLVFTSQHHEQVESTLFRVRGVLRLSSEELEARTALITLSGAHEFFDAPDSAHQLTVHLSELDTLESVRSFILHELQQRELDAQPLELLRWSEALPALYQFTLKDRQTAHLIFLIMGLIIAIGVLNTLTMSALERQKQFGVMMALGLTPQFIFTVIATEGLLLGICASLLGLVLGALFSWPVVLYGIDMGSMMGEGMDIGGVFIDTRVFAAWHLSGLLQFTLISVCLCVSAGLLPAWRTARRSALTAMRGPEHYS